MAVRDFVLEDLANRRGGGVSMKIELVNAASRYGDFWTHGVPPMTQFFHNRTSWFKDLSYEAAVIRKIISGDYSLLVDVGAGWGYHTIIGANNVEHVLAVEANALRYGLLLWNTQLYKNVRALWGFIGRKGQKARRSTSPWEPIEAVHPEIEVEAITVDGLLASYDRYPLTHRRGLVKVDVEGSELDVLAGASSVLNDPAMDWVIELHPRVGIKIEDVDEFMKGKRKEELSEKHFFYTAQEVSSE
jgi:FkbM family methyltransferase